MSDLRSLRSLADRPRVDRYYRIPMRLNELIRGKRGITADSALDLARVLWTTAKLWMNLQATYDLDQAAKKRKVA